MRRFLILSGILALAACTGASDAPAQEPEHDDVLNAFPPLERPHYVANFPMDCREGEGEGETLCRTCTVMALGAIDDLAVDAELYRHTLRRDASGVMRNAISAPLGRQDFSHDDTLDGVRGAIALGHAWCAAHGAVRLVVLKDELDAVLSGGDN
jgi:hypothetical protein